MSRSPPCSTLHYSSVSSVVHSTMSHNPPFHHVPQSSIPPCPTILHVPHSDKTSDVWRYMLYFRQDIRCLMMYVVLQTRPHMSGGVCCTADKTSYVWWCMLYCRQDIRCLVMYVVLQTKHQMSGDVCCTADKTSYVW